MLISESFQDFLKGPEVQRIRVFREAEARRISNETGRSVEDCRTDAIVSTLQHYGSLLLNGSQNVNVESVMV